MKSLFARGFKGLSDTLFSGVSGSVYRSVGIDHKNKPGVLKAHQTLAKHSGETVDELCKVGVSASDGSKLWFSSVSGKIWREVSGTYTLIYTLALSIYDLRTVTPLGRSFNVANEVGSDSFPFFGVSTSSRLFVADFLGDSFSSYAVTGGDISTATGADTKDVSSQISSIRGAFLRENGEQFFLASSSAIFRYSGSAYADASSWSYDTNTKSVSAQTTDVAGVWFSSDGTKMYVKNGLSSAATVYQYTLSTPWDLSTATYDTVSLSLSDFTSTKVGLSFSPDGKKMYVGVADQANAFGEGIYQYDLSTAWDLSTATFNDVSFLADKRLINHTSVAQPSFYTRSSSGADVTYMFLSGTPPSNIDIEFRQSIISGQDRSVFQFTIEGDDVGSVSIIDAEEHTGPSLISANNNISVYESDAKWVYFATEKFLLKIYTDQLDAADVSLFVQPVGAFKNGNATHHPMVGQNTTLNIGDGNIIAQVLADGTYISESFFNLPEDEIVQALAPFDVDVVVGTKAQGYGRTLRWDGLSESWDAEDKIFEKEGVLAFILDDNYVYPVGGSSGSIYFYNGAKCEDFLSIPEIEGTDGIYVHPNAVGFFMKSPIFGISNDSGNPVLQGIYGYGSYSTRYAKSLTLDYPMPSGEFSNVVIGAILVDGSDLYAAWTDAEDTGIAKIDWTTKYAAYMETMALTPAMNRHQIKTLSDALVPYFSLPASTGVTIGIKKAYDASYASMNVVEDSERKLIKVKNPSVPKTANPQLRIGLTVNGNSTPEIEDVLFDIAPIGRK